MLWNRIRVEDAALYKTIFNRLMFSGELQIIKHAANQADCRKRRRLRLSNQLYVDGNQYLAPYNDTGDDNIYDLQQFNESDVEP